MTDIPIPTKPEGPFVPEPVAFCVYCETHGCDGTCDIYYETLSDDMDARYEHWRDREVA